MKKTVGLTCVNPVTNIICFLNTKKIYFILELMQKVYSESGEGLQDFLFYSGSHKNT
jgi:hypothetical protein